MSSLTQTAHRFLQTSIVSLLFFTIQTVQAACPTETIRLALHDFPPDYYHTNDGQLTGKTLDRFAEVMRTLQCNWSTAFYPANKLLSKIATGNADAALLVHHPLLTQHTYYGVEPISELRLQLYRQPHAEAISQLKELPAGSRVIVRRGYGYNGRIETLMAMGSDITLVIADSHAEAIALFTDGQGDYLLNYEGPTLHYLMDAGMPLPDATALGRWPVYLLLSKRITNAPELLARFDETLKQLKSTHQ